MSDSECDSGVEEAHAKSPRPRCLADQLWPFLRVFTSRPKTMMYVFGASNGSFVLTGNLLYYLTRLLTLPGFLVVIGFGVYCLSFGVARAMTYPIYMPNILRGIEREVAKEVRRRVVRSSGALETACEELMTLSLQSNLSATRVTMDVSNIKGKIAYVVDDVLSPLQSSLERITMQQLPLADGGDQLLGHLTRLVALHKQVDLRLQDVNSAAQVHPTVILVELFGDLEVDRDALVPLPVGWEFYQQLKAVKLGAVALAEDLPVAETSSGKGRAQLYWEAIKETAHGFMESRKPFKGIASIHVMRADIESRHGGEQSWVLGGDGSTKIDTMFIQARGVVANAPIHKDNRTMILCNPNAAVYEYAAFQGHLVQFYSKLGYNTLLFNYRGYGRSEGKPTPTALCGDIEAIAKYLVEHKGVRKGSIGVHGESIGGVVATHLAKRANEFGLFLLVADRAFSSLPSAAGHLVGDWARKALQKVVGWIADNVQDYIEAPNSLYKVVTCDPNDEIINNYASLKMGVTQALLQALSEDVVAPLPGIDASVVENQVPEQNAIGVAAFVFKGRPAWLVNKNEVNSFTGHVLDLISVVERLHEFPGLGRDLSQVLQILWHIDGLCGEHFGTAFHRWMEEFTMVDAVTGKPIRPTGPETESTKTPKDHPVQLWMMSLVSWGVTAPEYQGLSHAELRMLCQTSTNSQQPPVRMWHLSGESGFCGSVQYIPIKTAARVIHKFVQSQQAALLSAGLLDTLQGVNVAVSQLEEFFSANKVRSMEIGRCLGHLVPLTCGHNGLMNPNEEESLLYHVTTAAHVLEEG